MIDRVFLFVVIVTLMLCCFGAATAYKREMQSKQQVSIMLQYNEEEVKQLLKDEYSRGFNDGLEFANKLYDRDIEIEQFKMRNKK